MENINEFLYGKDYSKKIDKFNKVVGQIHTEYNGEFDTTSYFTMQPHNQKGEVKLEFDQNKDIPSELKKNNERF
ncbi:hypothetical protein Q4Q35_18885 [Flavivirga aquimarina]|uniref:DUF1433 domain-containing protein n=1 Tax=Flavivirga aquimarina TaxID=2027862 RepID=A0ABT8WFP3_9FLAO|nr:hypothetical protein [Flavivirga aquimarina]MDO5971873.1 hypothetical protein [Flavivirga aquimarina]